MVQNNKILTVSYGTFSCTLEGFDDAFGTMKAIAEYFRDLAAEDRYFGAEPPQPDADMLAHIAQKEISRRVEAHRDDSGIVLRASEATQTPAVAPAPAAAALVAEAPVTETPSAAEGVESAAAPQEAAQPDTAAAEVAEPEAPAPETASEMVAEAEVEPAPTDVTEGVILDDASGADITDDAAAFFADSPAPEDLDADLVDAAEVTPVAPALAPAADSIAAKLQRIRAVVSKGAQPEGESFSEDEHAEPLASEASALEDDLGTQVVADVAPDAEAGAPLQDLDDETPAQDTPAAEKVEEVAPPETAGEDSAPETVDPVSALLADVAAQSATDETPSDATESDSLEDDTPVAAEDTPKPAKARVVKVTREEFDAMLAADRGEEAEAEPRESSLSADEEADLLRELAEVEAEMRGMPTETADDTANTEAAMAEAEEDAGEVDELDEIAKALKEVTGGLEDADTDAGQAADTSPAQDQTDADAELTAALDAAMDGTADDTMDAADDLNDAEEEDDIDSLFAETAALSETAEADAADDFEEERAILSADVDQDADASRIMEEAGDKLNDPNTSGRRSEFAHLRAAMAAGKAEEAAGGSIKDETSDDPYREDLARVVRPRRPDAADTRERSRRPQDEKPAPLKLVAAQRVDNPSAPVQPRRVMSSPIAEEDDGKVKFSEYAESVGAVELPELLEAAAAYLSFVEGHDQFSRPQLMTKVRMVEQDDFSREDGLRSFGVLLRDGKIEKTQAGRFTVSDRIGFRPEDMRAAG